MAPLEVSKLSTPPYFSPSSSAATHDSSESSDDNSAAVVPRARCSRPGRRLIGGRIYDSVLGVTCHWCRQKTVEDHVFCCHCNIAFCGGCLKNRHGEDIEIEMKDDVEWTCPKCRGGCGLGCENCCNCGPCRKAQGLEPTGLLVHTARACGFTNVHDYLIFKKTGESEEIIAKRKQGKGWCQTNPTSFHKKQKRVKDDTEIEAGCRKRLSFTSCDTDSQAKRCEKSLQSNALLIKEFNPSSNVLKDDQPHQAGSLQIKVDGPKSRVLTSPSEKAISVQLKLEPDSHVHGDPRSMAAVSSQGKATNVQPHFQCELRSLPSPQRQLDVVPPSHVKVEQVVCKGNSQQSVVVKREVDLQPKHSASCDKRLRQVKQECLDQPVEIREVPKAQLLRVKEEIEDQCSQPLCYNVALNQYNVFATAFSGDEGDAAWCRFSDFPSASTALNNETLRNDSDGGYLAIPSTSNFHLYPRNPIPMFSYVKKEVIDERHAQTRSVTAKLESMNSQEAQCSTGPCLPAAFKGRNDKEKGSLYSTMSFSCCERAAPMASVKKEREDGGNGHCPTSATKSTINVKFKAEREDFSFTIEPVQNSSTSGKDGRLSMTQVKEEVILDTPMPEVICIDDYEAQPETSAELKKGSLGALSHLWKVDDFKSKLEAKLAEPFSSKELEKFAAAASHRKPIYKARETRQGCSQFVSEEEGYSYLDHHPDLALQLETSVSPMARLSLLRGFFFWLEHASTHGAFKPWTSGPRLTKTGENDDCVEIDGPDCEILAVVCSLDEEVHGENRLRRRKNSGVL